MKKSFSILCAGVVTLVLVVLAISCGGGGGGGDTRQPVVTEQEAIRSGSFQIEKTMSTVKVGANVPVRVFGELYKSYQKQELTTLTISGKYVVTISASVNGVPLPRSGNSKYAFYVDPKLAKAGDQVIVEAYSMESDLLAYVVEANTLTGGTTSTRSSNSKLWQNIAIGLAILAICPSDHWTLDVTDGSGGNVTPPPVDQKVLTISGPTSLKTGQTGQYTASLNGQAVSVSWDTTSGTISNNGLLTAPNVAGQLVVTGNYNGQKATITVIVTATDIPITGWYLLFEGTSYQPGDLISLPAPGSAKFTLVGKVNGQYLNWDLTVGPSGSVKLPLGDPDEGPLVVCQIYYSAPGGYILRVSEFAQKENYVAGNSPSRFAEWPIHVANGKGTSSLFEGQRLFFTLTL
jgi:hypothetical protein